MKPSTSVCRKCSIPAVTMSFRRRSKALAMKYKRTSSNLLALTVKLWVVNLVTVSVELKHRLLHSVRCLKMPSTISCWCWYHSFPRTNFCSSYPKKLKYQISASISNDYFLKIRGCFSTRRSTVFWWESEAICSNEENFFNWGFKAISVVLGINLSLFNLHGTCEMIRSPQFSCLISNGCVWLLFVQHWIHVSISEESQIAEKYSASQLSSMKRNVVLTGT